MSYIEKMCFVNWRFRSFVQHIYFTAKQGSNAEKPHKNIGATINNKPTKIECCKRLHPYSIAF